MIPQPFVKGGGERVFFGRYEYVPGADIIFDFGNTICTSAFNASRIVYNAASANVTASVIPISGSNTYPTLSATNGGTMVTNAVAAESNYIQWDWKSTEKQTTIYLFALNGAQLNPYTSNLPYPAGASSIATYINGANPTSGQTANLLVEIYDSSNTPYYPLPNNITSATLNVSGSNGRNGYNMVGVEANESTSQNLYINQTLTVTGSASITRTTSGIQTNKFPYASNMRIMAYLQYPFILTPKQIRQTYKVFAQSFNA